MFAANLIRFFCVAHQYRQAELEIHDYSVERG
jgi:hypothetical protein